MLGDKRVGWGKRGGEGEGEGRASSCRISSRVLDISSFELWVETAYTQQGRAHSRRLHPDRAARPRRRKQSRGPHRSRRQPGHPGNAPEHAVLEHMQAKQLKCTACGKDPTTFCNDCGTKNGMHGNECLAKHWQNVYSTRWPIARAHLKFIYKGQYVPISSPEPLCSRC
jgi:hypothetical protein